MRMLVEIASRDRGQNQFSTIGDRVMVLATNFLALHTQELLHVICSQGRRCVR